MPSRDDPGSTDTTHTRLIAWLIGTGPAVPREAVIKDDPAGGV